MALHLIIFNYNDHFDTVASSYWIIFSKTDLILQKAGKTVKVLKLPLPKINISSLKVIFDDHRTYASPTAVSIILPLVFGYGNLFKLILSQSASLSLSSRFLAIPFENKWSFSLKQGIMKDLLVTIFSLIGIFPLFLSFEKTRFPLRLMEVQDVIDDSCSLCNYLLNLAHRYILKHCRLMFVKVYGVR